MQTPGEEILWMDPDAATSLDHMEVAQEVVDAGAQPYEAVYD